MLDEYGEFRDPEHDDDDSKFRIAVSLTLILISALLLWLAIVGAAWEI